MSAGYERDLEMSANPLMHTLGGGDLKSNDFVDDEVDFPSWPLTKPYKNMINHKFTASQWAYLADEANFANIKFQRLSQFSAGDKLQGDIKDVRN